MPEQRTGRRATDEHAVTWRDFARLRILLWVIAGICVLSWVGNGITVKVLTDSQRGEANERRNETCVLFERQERAAIHQLKQTYAYLEHPSPQLKDLTAIVRAQLDQTETDARASIAPPYCHEPDVGLLGRPVFFPKRPKNLR